MNPDFTNKGRLPGLCRDLHENKLASEMKVAEVGRVLK